MPNKTKTLLEEIDDQICITLIHIKDAQHLDTAKALSGCLQILYGARSKVVENGERFE